MGNFDRAAAVVKAMSDGNLPPDIEVIKTARGTNLSITNRMVMHFDTTIKTAPPDWGDIPMTPKANTEAGINHWIGAVLGNPETIRYVVKAVDEDGNTLMNGPDAIEDVLSLKTLNLQPIDLLYLIRNTTEESGTSELETRIRHVFVQSENLADNVIIKIEFGNNGEDPLAPDASIRSFAAILPLLDTMRDLISGSRTLDAQDFEPASKELVSVPDNPQRADVAELQARTTVLHTLFNNLFTALKDMLNSADLLQTEAATNNLRNAIKQVSDAGFPLSFPFSTFGAGEPERESLMTQAESLLERFDKAKYSLPGRIDNCKCSRNTATSKGQWIDEYDSIATG